MKKILFIFGALLLALSCKSGDEPLFTIEAYVSADKGTLYRDDGQSYIPTSNPGIDLNSGRYFINGYTTEDCGNNKYKMTIANSSNCRIGNPLIKSKIEDQKLIGDDAVSPTKIFAAGKYLSLVPTYYYFNDKDNHDINLVFDDLKSNNDTLVFELRHQANKDTLSVGKKANGLYFYISYDISQFASKDKNKMVVCLKNKWYKESGHPEREDCTNFLNYTY